MKANKLVELAFLATIALIIFIVEIRLPNLAPIPGIKLGLANIVTVYALYRYRAKEVVMLVLTRVVLGAILGGQMMALLYSLSGSLFCIAGMLLLRYVIPQEHLWIASVFGAVLHNIGQILAAMIILNSFAAAAYLPILIVSGCVAGTFTGLCAQMVVMRKPWQKAGSIN